ncbi:TetR family transcriptional regulator [Solirubrobacter taibaiensis]|nr:TetR family transcriptional regulator [Solirubrobacter taibaiensis]
MAPDRRRLILDAAISVIAQHGVRGLRVETVAAEAGVAVSLIYYYFGSRNGLVGATLDHANERAARVAEAGLRATLLAELDESARGVSAVWGEIQASAVFQPALQEKVREATAAWVDLVATAAAAEAPEIDARAAAERLTALVDGLAARWLAGALELDRARGLLQSAIDAELSANAPTK